MGSSPDFDAQVELLTRINTTEFIDSLGLGWVKWGRSVVAELCRPAARQISQDMARFDRLVAREGLQRGSRRILAELVGALEVLGAEYLPDIGPLLIVANHPGLCDVLAIFATVERDDLLVVAADYPLLRALHGFNRQFIFVRRDPHLKRQAFNEIVSHLRLGGAVLILAAGEIEPDPAVSADAVPALKRWSPSIGLIVHQVDAVSVVPAIVSGLLLPKFQRHPLTWIRRRPEHRQHLGSTLQVLARASNATTVRLAYGVPMTSERLNAQGKSARAVTESVIEQARMLMPRPAGATNAKRFARSLTTAVR